MVICFRFRNAFSIVTYLPREGPETLSKPQPLEKFHPVQIPIYLERGRKLTDSRTTENHHWVQLPIYLARGRKLCRCIIFLYPCLYRIDTYLPREGTETVFVKFHKLRCLFLYSYLPTYLERGRKLSCKILEDRDTSGIDTYLPREGPETFRI